MIMYYVETPISRNSTAGGGELNDDLPRLKLVRSTFKICLASGGV